MTTVAQALQDFYSRHNYGEEGGIHERFAWIKFGFVSLPFPNVAGRRKNVHLHDINHIVTGYGVSWKGESAVSAWEIASGGWGRVYVIWLMAFWAMGLGSVFYPRHVLRAFRRGLTMRNALACGLGREEMYSLPVDRLREKMSCYPAGNKHPFTWMVLSALFFLLPFILGALTFWMIASL